MNGITYLIIGVICVFLGIALLIPGIDTFTKIKWLENLITIITGFIPAFLILVGLLIAWLGFDEMRGG